MLACLLGLVSGIGASALKNSLMGRKHRGGAAWGMRRLAIGTQAPLADDSDGAQAVVPPTAAQDEATPGTGQGGVPPAAAHGKAGGSTKSGETRATTAQG